MALLFLEGGDSKEDLKNNFHVQTVDESLPQLWINFTEPALINLIVVDGSVVGLGDLEKVD